MTKRIRDFLVLTMICCVPALACTDAHWSQVTALGTAGEITCYSGGKVIFQGRSTGKIATEEGSDGWFFRDATTGKLTRVSGDCVITN